MPLNFKSILANFKGNLEHKITSPFLSTFIIIWVISKWEFIYTLFYFDSGTKLTKRIEKINLLFKNYSFYSDTWSVVWKSFAVLTLTYFLINLAKIIVIFFEKLINPIILKMASESKVVDRKDLEEVKNELKRIKDNLQEEKDLKINIQNDLEDLEKRYKELKLSEVKEIMDTQIVTPDEKTPEDKEDVEDFYDKAMVLLGIYKKDEKLLDGIEVILDRVNNNEPMAKSSLTKLMLNESLIYPEEKIEKNVYVYGLTGLGKSFEDVVNYYNLTK